VAGEKAKVATTLTDTATAVLLKDIFNVDKVHVLRRPHVMDEIEYALMRDGKVVCNMKFDETTPLEDRVTALRVAMRMSDGNFSQGEGSSPS